MTDHPLLRISAITTRLLLCSAIALTTSCVSAAESGWQVPSTLSDKVLALDANQQAFITSGDFIQYMPARQMAFELNNRDTAAMAGLLNDLLAVAGEMGYDPQRDMGAMPLNLSSSNFNFGVILPPILRKEVRSPRPIWRTPLFIPGIRCTNLRWGTSRHLSWRPGSRQCRSGDYRHPQ